VDGRTGGRGDVGRGVAVRVRGGIVTLMRRPTELPAASETSTVRLTTRARGPARSPSRSPSTSTTLRPLATLATIDRRPWRMRTEPASFKATGSASRTAVPRTPARTERAMATVGSVRSTTMATRLVEVGRAPAVADTTSA
jgi:hypothetical protein